MRDRVAIPKESTPERAEPAPATPDVAVDTPETAILRLQASAGNQATTALLQRKANTTGLPDQLKSSVEQLSGVSLDDVKVHYASDKPAQMNALAYAQGTDIYVGPGQEKHVEHEAWHVVQQKQGRVQPTQQL